MTYMPWRELNGGDHPDADVYIKGIPFDGAASVGKGSANAPDMIRQLSKVLPPVTEAGIILKGFRVKDEGDFDVNLNWEQYFKSIEHGARKFFDAGKFCLFIGGDHSVSIPLENAFCNAYAGKKIGVIHFDAHSDILDAYNGHGWSHACTQRRALENKYLQDKGLTLVGIRSYEVEEIKFLAAHPDICVIPSSEIYQKGVNNLLEILMRRYHGFDAIYMTIDIDVLDPAFAPGTGTPEGGGLSTREMMEIVKWLVKALPVKAMDIVEISPPLDSPNHITSWAALKIIYEVFGAIHQKKYDK